MHTATILTGPAKGEDVRFRKLDALKKRLGGTDLHRVHDTAFNPSRVRFEVLKKDRRDPSAWHIICRISVPAEAVADGTDDD